MATKSPGHEPFVSYWVPVKEKPARVQDHFHLTFCNYLRHIFSDIYPCPPRCLNATAIGQAYAFTTPLLTLFLSGVAWFLFNPALLAGALWLKLVIATVVGIPVGVVIGYCHIKAYNRIIEYQDFAVSKEDIRQAMKG
jgi:hypothetical protein